MRHKHYRVTVRGCIDVDTIVVLTAKSGEEAARIALEEVRCEEWWLGDPSTDEDPTVFDVSEVQGVGPTD